MFHFKIVDNTMPTPFLFGNYFGMLILVYHRRKRLELTMPHTTNVIDLKLKIQSLTQILPQNEKLFFRGT